MLKINLTFHQIPLYIINIQATKLNSIFSSIFNVCYLFAV